MRRPLLMMRTRSLLGSMFAKYEGARAGFPLAKSVGEFIRRSQAILPTPLPPADFIAGTGGANGQLPLMLRGEGIPKALHSTPIWVEDFEGIWQEYGVDDAVWRGGRKVGSVVYNTETDGSLIAKERVINGGDWVSGSDYKFNSHGDHFAQFNGTAGNWIITPDHPSHRPTGNLTIVHKIALESYTPTSVQIISLSGSDFNAGTNNHTVYIDIDGRIKLIRNSGSTNRSFESGINSLIDGQVYYIRIDYTQDNGADPARSEAAFSFSVNGVDFTPIGSPDTNSNTGEGNSDTSGFRIGAGLVGGLAMVGRVYDTWIIEGAAVLAHFRAGDNPYNAPSHDNPDLYGEYYARFTQAAKTILSPDSAKIDVSTQMFVGCKIRLADYSPTVSQYIASKWQGVGHQRSWYLQIITTGRIRLVYDPDGTNTTTNFLTSTVIPSSLNGKDLWVGAAVNTVTQEAEFYIREPGQAWQAIGVGFGDVVQAQIFNSTANLQCSGTNDVSTQGIIGRFYELVLYDDYNRTNLVAHFDASANPNSDPTHVSSATGETWTWDSITSDRDGQETWNWQAITSAKDEDGAWLPDNIKGRILVANDNLLLQNGNSATSLAYQELATIVGRKYQISIQMAGAENGAIRIGTLKGGTDIGLETLFVGDRNEYSFIAETAITHITLGALTGTKDREVYFKHIRIHIAEPTLAFNLFATNEIVDSFNLVGNLTNAPVVTYDQIGLRGDINGATKVEDTNPVTHSFMNIGTTINSATVTLRYFIESDDDNTRLVGVGMLLGGNNLVYHFNTSTGEITLEIGNVGTAPKVSVHKTGKWWVVCVEDSAGATANTVNVYVIPARALVAGTPGEDTTEVGSIVVGQLEVYQNTIINQIQHAPPIFNSGGANSIAQTRYQFDLSNHNQEQGLWAVKWTPLYADITHGLHSGIISLKTSSAGSVIFDRSGGSQLGNFDDSLAANTPVISWEPRDIIPIASPHGDSLMNIGVNGELNAIDTVYDGEYLLNNRIELGVNATSPMDFSQISFWDVDYTEAKQIGLDFLNYIPDSRSLLAANAVTHNTDGVTHLSVLVTHTP